MERRLALLLQLNSLASADRLRRAIVAGDHCFTEYQERRCLDARSDLNDGREAVGAVTAPRVKQRTRAPDTYMR